MTTRQVVLTADDVGVDGATLDVLVELARAGRITAASVIPMARHARRAVAALRPLVTGRFSVGLHATFTTGDGDAPWEPCSGSLSLRRPGRGEFHADVADFAEAAQPDDVGSEIEAQLRWFEVSGVRPTHLDSHQGAIYGLTGPHFLHTAVLACSRHRLALRLPRRLPPELGAIGPRARLLHRAAVGLAQDLGVVIPETVVTDWRPGSTIDGFGDLRRAYVDTIRRLPEGLSEVFLHPAAAGTPREGAGDHAKRRWELDLLRDDRFFDALAAEGIEVVTWPSPGAAVRTDEWVPAAAPAR